MTPPDLKTIPHSPGVYLFKKGTTILYTGKAGDLRNRLSFYFRKNAGEKVRRLREQAESLETIVLTSEIEALIKEAELIKKYQPPFNVLMRDDKNYSSVAITREEFPKIFITHQPFRSEFKKNIGGKSVMPPARYLGPFTHAAALKTVLNMLRRTYPYCTCKTPHARACLSSQIGKCPGYCCLKNASPTLDQRKQYAERIKHIVSLLTGKKKNVVRDLKRQMTLAAREERFEDAIRMRSELESIEDIFAHRLHLSDKGAIRTPNDNWIAIEKNIRGILGISSPLVTRVEGYDISNISGTSASGSMVVFRDGKPDKSAYRMFRIKTVHQISDVDMLKEVFRRRLSHPEWPMPELIIVDGGKPQLGAALSIIFLMQPSLYHRTVGLAKREEELFIPGRSASVRLDGLPDPTAFFFQRVRDESHRFAKRYHHKIREITLRRAPRV